MGDSAANSGNSGNPGGLGGSEAGGGSGNNGGHGGGTSPSIPSYTLPGVLHFIQVEWRRFERERNEWAIERNELRTRLGTLEGANRGLEQLKTDLTRRVKMLEYALRQERAKYLQLQTLQPSPSTLSLPNSESAAPISAVEAPSTLAPPAPPAARVPDRSSTFGPSSTLAPPDRPPTTAPDRPGTAFEGLGGGGGTFLKYSKGWGTVRSREILRNYLQEADHLSTLVAPVLNTSLSAVPSPTDDVSGRSPHNAPEPLQRARSAPRSGATRSQLSSAQLSTGAAAGGSSSGSAPYIRSPSLPSPPSSRTDDHPPPTTSLDDVLDDVDSDISSRGSGRRLSDSGSSDGGLSDDNSDTGSVVGGEFGRRGEKRVREEEEDGDAGRPKDRIIQASATMVRIGKGGQGLAGAVAAATAKEEEDLTARINPGKLSRAMKSADSYAENRRPGSAGPNGRRVNGRPDDLAALELSEEDTVDVEKKGAAGYAGKIWKPKFALRNHLDTVRAVAWHPTELVLFSAGEDSVAKMWDLRQYGNLKGRRPPTDIEPTYTFRGHTAAVTSLAVSFSGGRTVVYTGGADSTVRAWLAPFGEGGRVRESYASYFDTKTKLHTFVGHSNAVWDVKPHPIPHQYSLLASASADGTVKLWSLPDASGAGGYKLKATIRPPSVKVAPTSLDWCPYDLTKIVVGYTDATARVVDVTKVGQDGDGEVLRFSRPDGSDGTPSSQINRLVAHPTTAVCVAGYEDRYLRFLDMTSGSYAHQMVAHLDGVAAVDIHPSGLTVASGGHDYSIRFWDMNTRVCSQEISAHRRKYDEGVWSVAYRPSVYSGWFASGGADAIAKVYTLDA